MMRILFTTSVLALALVVCGGSYSVSAQDGAALSTSQPKGKVADIEVYAAEVGDYIKNNAKSGRIFANVGSDMKNDGGDWREFKTEDELKSTDTGDNVNESGFVWMRDGKAIGARLTFQNASHEWQQIVMYYFRSDGSLAKSDSTLNTINGGISVVRQDYYDSKGMLLKGTTHCKDLKTQQSRPCGDLEDKPAPLYKTFRELPFYKLLK